MRLEMDDKLKNLRERGILQSYTDREIDLCFMKCMVNDDSTIDRIVKSTKTTYWKATRRMCFITMITFSSITLLLCLILLSNAELRAQALRLGHNYMYPVMRTVRYLALPFISRVHLSGYHDAFCLIDNPYYEHSITDVVCSICEQTSSFDNLEKIDSSTFEHRYLLPMRSVLIKDISMYTVSFDQVRKQYHETPQLISSGINTVMTNRGQISDHLYLMTNTTTEDILRDETFHLQWISQRVGPSRFFSKIFPKPEFFPEEREMSLEKILLIDSCNSKSFDLPHGRSDHMLYIQASGRRTINFRPLLKCEKECSSFTVHLQSGDLVFFHRPAWDIKSEPFEDVDQKEISLAYIATF